VPYLLPEIVLLFKAKHRRPKDRADFDGVLPLLDRACRGMAGQRTGEGASRTSVARRAGSKIASFAE
jgi:hypothetical protein